MTYKVISTGSHGNAVLYHNQILVDIGVSQKVLAPYLKYINLILLTHQHSDHINKATLKAVLRKRPAVRVACGAFMYEFLRDAGIPRDRIDILERGVRYKYKTAVVSPVSLYHNVPNYGWRIFKDGHKLIHMTDTSLYDGIVAKDYDLYAIEGNYDEELIHQIIAEEIASGVTYPHGIESQQNHASVQQAKDFYYENRKKDSELLLLHPSSTYL